MCYAVQLLLQGPRVAMAMHQCQDWTASVLPAEMQMHVSATVFVSGMCHRNGCQCVCLWVHALHQVFCDLALSITLCTQSCACPCTSPKPHPLYPALCLPLRSPIWSHV